MRKRRSYQRGTDLSTRSAEILDQHDIAFDLIHTVEKNPLPIGREIKVLGARGPGSEVHRSDCSHALRCQVQESDAGGDRWPVNEVNAVTGNFPPDKQLHAVE